MNLNQFPRFKFNPARNICEHLAGDNHTAKHRMAVGGIIIFIGVGIAQSGMLFHGFIHFFLDGVGYLVHGIGAIPFIEKIMEVKK